jgi:hypothetical protein
MRHSETDVVIIGAGPYGLSIAAHLKERGVDFRIFGRPMQTWLGMPRGMYLKSLGFATNVYTPDDAYSFVGYCKERGLEANEPCAIADFARYGIWAQERAIPKLERVDVTGVSITNDAFKVELVTGETIRAARVVVAAGVTHFARMPEELAELPPGLATHTLQHRDFDAFAGKDVCVIGAGQSALEAAALLREAGARPRVLVRGPEIGFSTQMPAHRTLWERIRRPNSGLGPGLKNWLLETFPTLAHYMPDRWRVRFVKKHLGPLGAWWLRDRIEGKVPVHTRCGIVEALPRDGRLVLRVREEGKRERELACDHVVAGSGYEVDLDRLEFLDPEVRARIRRLERAPALDRHFESSVPGLYFVGLASSLSFGPLFRFVAGADYTARALSRELSRRAVAATTPRLLRTREEPGAAQ